ncbi:MAG TPA: hypothetical protein VK025_08380 [Steroidobacter sp.]|nr:hypothetical protein [Steroidobacter sp.]
MSTHPNSTSMQKGHAPGAVPQAATSGVGREHASPASRKREPAPRTTLAADRRSNGGAGVGSREAQRWLEAARQALVSGTLASVLSTGVLMWLGGRRLGRPAAPTNATSHWLWGDEESFQADELSLRHTGVGYATHHASAVMWAMLLERWLARTPHPTSARIVRDAALISALAAFVDYQLTPRRLRPGFEARLPTHSLVGVFAALGVGLATGAILNRRHDRRLEALRRLP